MIIKKDLLRIAHGTRNELGERAEPEQQPVQRILQTDVPTGMQHGKQVGTIPGEVIYESTAGEMAQGARHQCFSCKHFDNDSWLKMKALMERGSREKRGELNSLRAKYAETHNMQIIDRSMGQGGPGATSDAGEIDVEHALSLLGICHPLTEIDGDAIIVDPLASCPPEVCTPTQPDGLYTPKDIASEKAGSAAFDNIMRRASGELG